MNHHETLLPRPEEIRREVEEFLRKKYGPTGINISAVGQPDVLHTDGEGQNPKDTPPDIHFDLKPIDIKAHLDRYVISQDDAKKVLATAICDHYNHIMHCSKTGECQDYAKQNIILVGPTGVGKTYLVRTLAELVGVPFVKGDATKYSETGYVGGDVEDLVRELVDKAGGNLRLAEYGIIYLDEVDKLATTTNLFGRDVSGHGVQRGLLKLMEETEVPLRSPTDMASQLQAAMDYQAKGKVERKTINTRHIMFIVSGAFTGLTDIIRKRLGGTQIGFMGGDHTATENPAEALSQAKATDFMDYGFEAEFVGRLPIIAVCRPLTVDDLYKILKESAGSIIRQYVAAFKAYDVEAIFTDEGLRCLAEKAYKEQTGARSLVGICERTLRDYKYELPNTTVKQFAVDAALVKDPCEVLQKILTAPGYNETQVGAELVERYEKAFADKYHIRLRFSTDAIAAIVQRAKETGQSPAQVCDQLFHDYEYGLTLIHKKTGCSEFQVTREVLQDPVGALDQWIRKSYTSDS
ncbi:MAG: AAA family ATPase [Acidobacteria bacterium]|nr:AAA family ATPase [Acidobacteriota bacterium]MBI3655313.1 AAA family ATPase [Acidobacteriota bacterium]